MYRYVQKESLEGYELTYPEEGEEEGEEECEYEDPPVEGQVQDELGAHTAQVQHRQQVLHTVLQAAVVHACSVQSGQNVPAVYNRKKTWYILV